jgi:RNA polymerase sigma-70 factor (ECF subfamily)
MTDSAAGHPDGPPDAALVARIRAGDAEAFAALMDRYSAAVLTLIERLVGDPQDAREIAQDVFLQVHRRIGQLRRPQCVGAWLWTTARNHALVALRKRCRTPGVRAFDETGADADALVWRSSWAPPTPARSVLSDELRAQVRERIDALSRAHRQVIRLFYLEGLSVAEIAARCGIPAGTVKWRLSQAREQLRRELAMSEVSDDLRNRTEQFPLLDVTAICGSSCGHPLTPERVCRTLLAQQILYFLRKHAAAPEQIASAVKADVRYVRDHVDRMTEAEVLAREDDRYRANCILLDRDDLDVIVRDLSWRPKVIAQAIGGHTEALARAVERLSAARLGIEPGYLRWLILPTMVLSFGLRRRLAQTRGAPVRPPARPDGGEWFFLPRLADGPGAEELGCNLYSIDGLSAAQYWNTHLRVQITRPGREDLLIIHRLARGPVRTESLRDVYSESIVASMAERGLLRIEGDSAVATVPLFTPEDGRILQPVIDGMLSDILEEAFADYPDDIYAALERLGFSFVRSDWPVHAHALAVQGTARALVDADILQMPPVPVPRGWGLFVWTGVFTPMPAQGA